MFWHVAFNACDNNAQQRSLNLARKRVCTILAGAFLGGLQLTRAMRAPAAGPAAGPDGPFGAHLLQASMCCHMSSSYSTFFGVKRRVQKKENMSRLLNLPSSSFFS